MSPQLGQGAPGDVFASANPKQMTAVLANVVSYEQNVRAVFSKAALGRGHWIGWQPDSCCG